MVSKIVVKYREMVDKIIKLKKEIKLILKLIIFKIIKVLIIKIGIIYFKLFFKTSSYIYYKKYLRLRQVIYLLLKVFIVE